MRITFLTSNPWHDILNHIRSYIATNPRYKYSIVHKSSELTGGDILFLASCHEIIPREIRSKYQFTFVLHASELCFYRGWSPVTWGILKGGTKFRMYGIEALDKVDSGKAFYSAEFEVPPHVMRGEISKIICNEEINAIDFLIKNVNKIISFDIDIDYSIKPLKRRNPEDSKVDLVASIDDIFNKLRVADNDNYPVYFEKYGRKYILKLSLVGNQL